MGAACKELWLRVESTTLKSGRPLWFGHEMDQVRDTQLKEQGKNTVLFAYPKSWFFVKCEIAEPSEGCGGTAKTRTRRQTGLMDAESGTWGLQQGAPEDSR